MRTEIAIISALTLVLSMPLAFGEIVETKGQNYDLVENFFTGEAVWESHPERIMDGGWQNYALTNSADKVIFNTNAVGSFVFDKNSCSYSIYGNGFDGEQIIPSVSAVATYLNNGQWQNLPINDEACMVSVDRYEDGVFLTSTKVITEDITEDVFIDYTGTTEAFYANSTNSQFTLVTNSTGNVGYFNGETRVLESVEVEKFVQEIRLDINSGFKETFKVWHDGDEQLGVSQTIHTGESITIGDQTINIAELNGQSFDRQFIVDNQAEILQIANNLNYDFDTGIDSLSNINIIFDGDYKVNMDYSDGGFVGYLEIDPTFTQSTNNHVVSSTLHNTIQSGSGNQYNWYRYGSLTSGYHSASVFDVSSIGASYVVTDVEYSGTVQNYYNGNDGATCNLVGMTNTPASYVAGGNSQAQNFANDIWNSNTIYVNNSDMCTQGSNGHNNVYSFTDTFNSVGIAHVQSQIGSGSVYFGHQIKSTSTLSGFTGLTSYTPQTLTVTYILPTIPSSITDLSSSQDSSGNVNLSWTLPNDNGNTITSFKIYRDIGSGYILLDTVNSSTLISYQDTNPSSTINAYKVNAVNGIGEASDSNVTPSQIPDTPTGLTTVTGVPIELNWSTGTTGEPFYHKVFRTTNEYAYSELPNNSANSAGIDFTGNEFLTHGFEDVPSRDSTFDGTNNGATTGQTGKIDSYSWDFDGSNDLVSINPSISSYCDLSDCSVSAWINLDTVGTTKAIIGSRDSGNGGEGWIFRVNSAGGLTLLYDEVTNQMECNGSTTLSTNTWYHVGFSYDYTSGNPSCSMVDMYVNGVNEGSLTQVVASITSSQEITHTQPTTIGSNDSTGGSHFDGNIDQVLVYSKALSQSEVTELYNSNSGDSTPDTNGLIAHYNFEQTGNTLENQGTITTNIIPDKSTNNISITVPSDVAFEDVVWDTNNMSGGTASGSTFTGSVNGWSNGIARSVQSISPETGGGEMTCTKSDTYAMCGFSSDPFWTSGDTWKNGDYMMYRDEIYEFGSGLGGGAFSSSTGSVFKITMDENGQVDYYVDGTYVDTSSVTASGDYYVLATPYNSGNFVTAQIGLPLSTPTSTTGVIGTGVQNPDLSFTDSNLPDNTDDFSVGSWVKLDTQTATLTASDPDEDGYVRDEIRDNDCADAWTSSGSGDTNLRARAYSATYDCEVGYIEWNTSSIPDNAIITNVELLLDVQQSSLAGIGCEINPVTNQPTAGITNALLTDLKDGTPYITDDSQCDTVSDGATFDLGSSADTDLQNLLSSDWFAVGLWLDDDTIDSGTHYWFAKSEESATNDPTLTVTYEAPPTNIKLLNLNDVTFNVGTTSASVDGISTTNVDIWDFDGSNDNVFSPLSLPSSSTTSFWINPDSLQYGTLLIDESGSTGSGSGIGYRISGSGNILMEDYTTTWVTLTSSTSLTPNTWYNVVMVRDSTVGKQIYINGVLDTSTSYSSVTPLGDIRIGGDYYSGNIVQTFDGKIDDVKIWNRALTSTEISDVYDGTSVTNGLVTHYNFDQKSGNLLDQVGSNDATNNGATPTTGQISSTYSIISATGLTDNTSTPQHYTFTRSNNDWTIYQNGVSQATATDTTSLGSNTGVDYTVNLDGMIDEYFINSDSLTSTEVDMAYDKGIEPTQIATTGSTTTDYDDSNVTGGNEYYYTVKATNAIGDSNFLTPFVSALAGTPPDVPTSVSSAINNPNTAPLDITVSWSAPTNVGTGTLTGFEIYRDSTLITTTGLVSSYTDTVPTGGGTFEYKLKAVSTHGTSGFSATTTTTTPTVPPAPTNAPALAINNPNPSPLDIEVSWTEPSSGGSTIQSYEVFRSATETGTYTSVGTVTDLDFTDTVPSAGTWYYKFTAINLVGSSGLSPFNSITTASVPSSPLNASSVIPSINSAPYDVTVSWDLPTSTGGSALTGYNVYRQTGTGAFSLITTTTALGYVDTVPTALNQDYTYKIHAVNNVGESTGFVTTTITTFDVPDAPVLSFTTGTTALSWTVPNSDASITGYKIFRDSSLLTTVTTTSHSDFTPINFGQSYQYEVKAVSSLGDSASSNSIVTTPETEITGMVVQGITGTGAVIDWEEPAYYQGQITSYSVYYSTPATSANPTISAGTTTNTYSNFAPTLDYDTSYTFGVIVNSPLGNSGFSNLVNATTNVDSSIVSADPTTGGMSWFDIDSVNEQTFNVIEFQRETQNLNVNGTFTDVDTLQVGYPSWWDDMTCNVDYKFAQKTEQYVEGTDMTSTINPSDANQQIIAFQFHDIDNEVIELECAPQQSTQDDGVSAKFIMTQNNLSTGMPNIPLVTQIQGFQTGEYGTDGEFGALDIVGLFVILLSMVGFNRLSPIVGVLLSASLVFALAFFGIISIPTILVGVIALVIFLAWGITRNR